MDVKLAKGYFENFSTTTVIRVFNFIRTSHFLVERVFWILVLVVGAGATTWNVTQTVRTFLSEPTTSQITYVDNVSEGLHFEDAHICLEMRSDYLLNLYEPFTKLVLEQLTENANLVESLRKKVDRIHQLEDERADMFLAYLDGNVSTNDSRDFRLSAYHSFENANFDMFAPGEVALLGLTMVMFVRLVALEEGTTPRYTDWQSPSIRELYEAYVTKNTSFGELFVLTTEMACTLIQIRLVASHVDEEAGSTAYTPYNFCKRFAYVSSFGRFTRSEAICYPFGADPLSFYTQYDALVISMHAESLYRELAAAVNRISIDLEGAFQKGKRLLSARYNAKQLLEFSHDVTVIGANLRRRPCLTKDERKGHQIDCLYFCYMKSLVAACKCDPLSAVQQHPGYTKQLPQAYKLQECALWFGADFDNNMSSVAHEQCRAAIARDDSLSENCSEKCFPDCESSHYTSASRPAGPSLDRINATTVVAVRPTKFVYQVVNEIVTMDSQGFIAAVGGNLSLYLGASFLALIHIAVFIVRVPFERACAKNVEEDHTASVQASGKTKDTRLALREQAWIWEVCS